MTDRDAYYFAGGERIALRADPQHVGVDLGRATSLPKRRQTALRKVGRPLRGDVVLLECSAVPDAEQAQLDADGALLPAYHADDSTIVVLPEVRVELRDPKQVSDLRRRLERAGVDRKSIRARGGRVSFAPRSGRAEDALRLANDLYEELEPAASQARFLRVVPRPGR